jgi:hypothetical protein
VRLGDLPGPRLDDRHPDNEVNVVTVVMLCKLSTPENSSRMVVYYP